VKRRKRVKKMSSTVLKKESKEEMLARSKALGDSIARRMKKAGITLEEFEAAVRKAKADVRRTRCSDDY
jgi:hypothetical protein